MHIAWPMSGIDIRPHGITEQNAFRLHSSQTLTSFTVMLEELPKD